MNPTTYISRNLLDRHVLNPKINERIKCGTNLTLFNLVLRLI